MSRLTSRFAIAMLAAVLPAGAAWGQPPPDPPRAAGQIAPPASGPPLTLQ